VSATWQIALLRSLFRMLAWLPPRWTGAVGAGIGRLVFYLHRRRRIIAVRNVTRVHPDRDRRWRRRIARESFAELGRTVMGLPHVFLRPRDFLLSCVNVENETLLREALTDGRGVLVAACHHSNWELGALMLSMLGCEADCLYRPLRHPVADTALKQWRERFGARLHARQKPVKWLPRALKRGGCVPFMIDQHIADGVPAPFLGHLANTLTLPAAIIRKYHPAVLGVALLRHGRAFRFTLRFWRITPPAHAPTSDADTFHLLAAINRSFEAVIGQRPELWLWSHQRWKLLEEHPDIAEAVHGTP